MALEARAFTAPAAGRVLRALPDSSGAAGRCAGRLARLVARWSCAIARRPGSDLP